MQRPVVSQTNPVAQSSTEPQVARQVSPAHLKGAHSVVLPVRSFSVWSSMQMMRDTHVFDDGSQVAFVAQSPSFSHFAGHSSVPLHL